MSYRMRLYGGIENGIDYTFPVMLFAITVGSPWLFIASPVIAVTFYALFLQ